MTKREKEAAHLEARAAAYRLLSGAFREPVPAIPDAAQLREALASFPEGKGLPEVPEVPAYPEVRARRLFGHNLSPDCPPYETQYDDAGIFRRTQDLADLAGFYRAFGLDLAAGDRRTDHLPVELEFVAILCLKESLAVAKGRGEDASVCRRARARFLGEHLGRWIGAFAAAAGAKAPGDHFAALAALTAALVERDAAALGPEASAPKARAAVVEDPQDSACVSCIGGADEAH